MSRSGPVRVVCSNVARRCPAAVKSHLRGQMLELARELRESVLRMRDTKIVFRLDADSGPTWVLRLEGDLRGGRVNDVRDQWWRTRNADGGIPLLIERVGAEFVVDESGKALLAEMQRSGARVVDLSAEDE